MVLACLTGCRLCIPFYERLLHELGMFVRQGRLKKPSLTLVPGGPCNLYKLFIHSAESNAILPVREMEW
jgi:hypothetical protein